MMLGFAKLKSRLGLKGSVRKSQLGLFGPRPAVQAPGSRGGKYYVTDEGKVVYGTAPTPDHKAYDSQEQAEAAVAHGGASASKHAGTFRLAPPELGETRSGKPVPHPRDHGAYESESQALRHETFRHWSAADHADAAGIHDKYRRYFAARGRAALVADHAYAMQAHLAAQRAGDAGGRPPADDSNIAGESRHRPGQLALKQSSKGFKPGDRVRARATGNAGTVREVIAHPDRPDEHRLHVEFDLKHVESEQTNPEHLFERDEARAMREAPGAVSRRAGDRRTPEQLAEDSKYAWQYTMGAKTRSGKAIPDVDDTRAYQRVSQQGGGERRHLAADAHAPGGPMHGWSADDHRDAADYYQDFVNRGGQHQKHREASHAHLGEARILDQMVRPLSPEQHADEWKKHEATGDTASASAAQAAAVRKHGHLAKVPAGVQRTLRTHLDALRGHAEALESGRQTDRMFGGGGRYEHDAWVNRGLSEERLKTHHDAIAAFRTHAPKNGVDPDAVLSALGGVPEVRLSEKAAAHRELRRG